MSKPAGSRVRSIHILCTKCRVPQYEPVEDASVYTVVVPQYLVSGGDGYTLIRDEMVKHNSGEVLGPWVWVLGLGSWVLGSMSWVPGSWVPGCGFKFLGPRFSGLGPGFRVLGGRIFISFSPSVGDLDVSVVSRFISQRRLVFPAVEGRISIFGSASGPELSSALVLLGALLQLWTI